MGARILNFLTPLNRKQEYSHGLIEVLTGEGKSIVLGALSIFMSLVGYTVDCACYNAVLSTRDWNSFVDVFKRFNVDKVITYSTLDELAEKFLNPAAVDGSNIQIRDLAEAFIRTGRTGNTSTGIAKSKRVLLIDEVDVFFSNFYGETYNVIFTVNEDEVYNLLRKIWKERDAGSKLNSTNAILASPEGQALLSLTKKKYPMLTPTILSSQINNMREQVKNYKIGNPNVGTESDGKKRIQYSKNGTMTSDLKFGYATDFAYFHYLDLGMVVEQDVRSCVGLNIACGQFSYSEIPKEYNFIMGVTGTLRTVGSFEKTVIEDVYHIKDQAFCPSMYAKPLLSDSEKNGNTFSVDDSKYVQLANDLPNYYKFIQKEIKENIGLRPVLVFFESKEKIQSFLASSSGTEFKESDVVADDNTNPDHFVAGSCKAGKVTFFTSTYARGTDFRVWEKKEGPINKAGGVHVVLTYFCDTISDEVQAKGRTARQGRNGTRVLVLLLTDLSKFLPDGTTPADITIFTTALQAKQPVERYAAISDARKQKSLAIDAEKASLVQRALTGHQTSMDFRASLFLGKVDAKLFEKLNTDFLTRAKVEPLHILFCLDESGSMSSNWNGLLQAFSDFLNIRSHFRADDKISCIQYDSGARVPFQYVGLDVATQRASTLPQQGGGTCFLPPLIEVGKLLANDPNPLLNVLLVFMTDGQAGDDEAVYTRELQSLCSKYSNRQMQFYSIQFGTDDSGTLEKMANSVQGRFLRTGTDIAELRDAFQVLAQESAAPAFTGKKK